MDFQPWMQRGFEVNLIAATLKFILEHSRWENPYCSPMVPGRYPKQNKWYCRNDPMNCYCDLSLLLLQCDNHPLFSQAPNLTVYFTGKPNVLRKKNPKLRNFMVKYFSLTPDVSLWGDLIWNSSSPSCSLAHYTGGRHRLLPVWGFSNGVSSKLSV